MLHRMFSISASRALKRPRPTRAQPGAEGERRALRGKGAAEIHGAGSLAAKGNSLALVPYSFCKEEFRR